MSSLTNEIYVTRLALDLKVNLESEKIHITLPEVTLKIQQMPKPIPQVPLSNNKEVSPEDKIRKDFLRRIGHNVPKQQSNNPIQVPEDVNLQERKAINNYMNNISTGNNHYTASSFWMNSDASIDLFWKVIAHNRPGAIVKLINNELFNRGCPLYFPKEAGQSLVSTKPNTPKVTCIKKEEITDSLTLRILEVASAKETFHIAHIDFTGWPDFGVPDMQKFKVLMEVTNKECPETSPEKRLFVHCMGGMGRTGTFIGTHAGTHSPVAQRTEDLFYKIIMDMRSQRPLTMVEKPDQYLFMHQYLKQV